MQNPGFREKASMYFRLGPDRPLTPIRLAVAISIGVTVGLLFRWTGSALWLSVLIGAGWVVIPLMWRRGR